MHVRPVLSVLALVPLVGCPLADDDTPNDGSDAFEHTEFELALHDLVNAHREGMGLEPLALEGAYSAIARQHSADMAAGRVAFGHDGFDDRADAMVDHSPTLMSVGENVAWLSAGWDAPAEEVVNGWLDSPPHRETIESDFTHGGMGAAEDADGGWYATQLFSLEP